MSFWNSETWLSYLYRRVQVVSFNNKHISLHWSSECGEPSEIRFIYKKHYYWTGENNPRCICFLLSGDDPRSSLTTCSFFYFVLKTFMISLWRHFVRYHLSSLFASPIIIFSILYILYTSAFKVGSGPISHEPEFNLWLLIYVYL